MERTASGAKALGPVLVGLGLQSLITSLQILPCHLLDVQPWMQDSASLCLSFPICKWEGSREQHGYLLRLLGQLSQ